MTISLVGRTVVDRCDNFRALRRLLFVVVVVSEFEDKVDRAVSRHWHEFRIRTAEEYGGRPVEPVRHQIGQTGGFVVVAGRKFQRLGYVARRQWLAAIGTVCDVAPLTGFNRAIVAEGLKILQNGKNIGMVALAENAGRRGQASVYDFGFILGPRINAGGRVGDASLATKLLSTENAEEARELAATLEALNQERRAREAEMLADAESAALEEAEKRNVGRW